VLTRIAGYQVGEKERNQKEEVGGKAAMQGMGTTKEEKAVLLGFGGGKQR